MLSYLIYLGISGIDYVQSYPLLFHPYIDDGETWELRSEKKRAVYSIVYTPYPKKWPFTFKEGDKETKYDALTKDNSFLWTTADTSSLIFSNVTKGEYSIAAIALENTCPEQFYYSNYNSVSEREYASMECSSRQCCFFVSGYPSKSVTFSTTNNGDSTQVIGYDSSNENQSLIGKKNGDKLNYEFFRVRGRNPNYDPVMLYYLPGNSGTQPPILDNVDYPNPASATNPMNPDFNHPFGEAIKIDMPGFHENIVPLYAIIVPIVVILVIAAIVGTFLIIRKKRKETREIINGESSESSMEVKEKKGVEDDFHIYEKHNKNAKKIAPITRTRTKSLKVSPMNVDDIQYGANGKNMNKP